MRITVIYRRQHNLKSEHTEPFGPFGGRRWLSTDRRAPKREVFVAFTTLTRTDNPLRGLSARGTRREPGMPVAVLRQLAIENA